EHGLGKAQSSREAVLDEREESLHVTLGGGPEVGTREEAAHEAGGVLLRVGGGNVDDSFAQSLDALAGGGAPLPAGRDIGETGRDAGRAGFDAPEREVAKEQAVARARGLIVERALDLHPAECNARGAVFLHERIAEIVRA